MKKKLLSMMLVVAMLSSMVLCVHAEAPTAVATIGEVGYSTLKAALTASEDGDTVTLLEDISEKDMWITKSITLDLGGHTVDGGDGFTNAIFLMYDDGIDVTIKNGTVIGSKEQGRVVWAYVAESLTLNDVTVVNRAPKNNEDTTPKDERTVGGYAVFIGEGDVTVNGACNFDGLFAGLVIMGSEDSADPSKVVVNGGVIGNEDSIYGLCGNGAVDFTDITINGGTVQGYNMAIYHPQVGDLTINDGTVSGYFSGIQYSGEGALVVNGGTIEATTPDEVELYKSDADGDGGISESGAAILFMSRGGGYQGGDDTFTGEIHDGTIRSTANATVIVCRMGKDGSWVFDSEDVQIHNYLDALTITGGTFSGKQMSVEPVAESEGVLSIKGGRFEVAPSIDWLTAGYVVSETATGGYYTIVDQVTDSVNNAMDKVESVTPEDASANKETVNEAAGDLVAIPSEDLEAHADTVNKLDELFTAANEELETDNQPAKAVDVEVPTVDTSKTVEVSGLAISAYGGKTEELESDATTAVYIDVTQKNMVGDDLIEGETLDESAVTLEIKPMQTVTKDEVTSAPTIIDNAALQTPVTFTIPLVSTFEGNRAKIYHITQSGAIKVYDVPVYTNDDESKYIQMIVTEFSLFVVAPYTYVEPVISRPKYAISVADTEHGTAFAQAIYATENSTVTITTKPDAGYEVNTVTVQDESGEMVATSNKGNGSYTFKQPASKVTITVTFAEVDSAETGVSFVDVTEADWFYEAVRWALDTAVVDGASETVFAPYDTCTRAQAVTFLWKAAGAPEANGDGSFVDVAVDADYYDAVVWAVNAGITSGTSESTFSPDGACTRSQIVALLWRMVGNNLVDTEVNFTDVADDAWYVEAVRWAVTEGITAGTSDTTFSPADICGRAEVVSFLYRHFSA